MTLLVMTGGPPLANPTPADPRFIEKRTIIDRATDAELALLDAGLASRPLRERMLWAEARGGLVRVSDVRPLFAAMVGAARADELLAP